MKQILAIVFIGLAVGIHMLYATQQGAWIDIVSAVLFCMGLLVAYGRTSLGGLAGSDACQKYVALAKVGMAIIAVDAITALLVVNLIEGINRPAVFLVFMCVALVGFFLIGRYVVCLSRQGRSMF